VSVPKPLAQEILGTAEKACDLATVAIQPEGIRKILLDQGPEGLTCDHGEALALLAERLKERNGQEEIAEAP